MKALQCESAKISPKDMHKGKDRKKNYKSVKHKRERERKDKNVTLSSPLGPVTLFTVQSWWSQTGSVRW